MRNKNSTFCSGHTYTFQLPIFCFRMEGWCIVAKDSKILQLFLDSGWSPLRLIASSITHLGIILPLGHTG